MPKETQKNPKTNTENPQNVVEIYHHLWYTIVKPQFLSSYIEETPMKELLKNGRVINVFTGEIESADVLICDDRIIGVDHYDESCADTVRDVRGKYICPGLIDGHIHIESTTLSPAEFARTVVPHGTTAVLADPHEIANVCGCDGIEYMLAASEGLPLSVYIALPSCVPATPFCESGAELRAAELSRFYSHPRVLSLGEVMNYVGVLGGDADLLQKIADARAAGKLINGHAPLLSGTALDAYIACGIGDDHECTSPKEAMERIRKGQRLMIRQGAHSHHLRALLPLFEQPWASRCLLVTDDKHPAELLQEGHLDDMIRVVAREGKDPVTAIRMATLWAAEALGLSRVGAIAPGYRADLVVVNDPSEFVVEAVYYGGVRVAENGEALPFDAPTVPAALAERVHNSFHLGELSPADFRFDAKDGYVGVKDSRVISLIPGELLTDELIAPVDYDVANGVDVGRDILKIAVIERHGRTSHRALGLIRGTGLKRGAVASSVSHDSHNLIVIGCDERDMAAAANCVREMGGGYAVVADGEILSTQPLPLAGLMSTAPAAVVAQQNEEIYRAMHTLGVPRESNPLMAMAFAALPVIPHLKLTTQGLVNGDTFERVSVLV
jgi:adenine deaminase